MIRTSSGATIALFVAISLVASCSLLPRPGPGKREVFAGSVLREGNAFVVTVTPRVSRITATQPPFGFSGSFSNAAIMGADVLAPGDKLRVTVFENVRDGSLLGESGQRIASLEEIQIDGQGYIFVPYAGRIKAAGQTPEKLRGTITGMLEPQTPDPQVSISRVAGDGSSVAISGRVAQSGIFPIEQPTRTLAAMIANAGGISIPPETAIVRVTRGRETGKIWLQDLWSNPSLDIALRPGDHIVVEEDKRRFNSLGATGTQALVPFQSETLSAIEALARVGGLQSSTADPTGVFVMRNESADTANRVLGRSDLIGQQRIVYVLNLTSPTGIFEARDFLIHDGDTIYVTEAPYVQWYKILRAVTSPAADIATTVNKVN